MADFIYSKQKNNSVPSKFVDLYKNKQSFSDDLDFYYNDIKPEIISGENSLAIIGYASCINCDKKAFLTEILVNFNEGMFQRIKKELIGQYILIIKHNDYLYICADFMQVRTIYYSLKDNIISSSFGAVNEAVEKEYDPYRCFEFTAMKHCMYPRTLGNSTINNRIKKVRAYEYMKINLNTFGIEIKEIAISLNNQKINSVKKLTDKITLLLEQIVNQPDYRDKSVITSVTGGFDSRIISAFANKYYPDLSLRISVFKDNINFLDNIVATKVAKAFGKELITYQTDKEAQKGFFFNMTDGLSPKENSIITSMLHDTGSYALGFGGVFGTEIFSVYPYENEEDMINKFSVRARSNVKAKEEFYKRFEEELRRELNDISLHYEVIDSKHYTVVKLFMIFTTAAFSSPLVAAFDIYGKQCEPFGTFPLVETALQIPDNYCGGKYTFGRFYMIPKSVMKKINSKVSMVTTSHFCPMAPLSLRTFIPYVKGRFDKKRYFAKLSAERVQENKNIKIETADWNYCSNDWIEGFKNRYID